MATNNQLNSPLSGESGTGNYASSTNESYTTPTLGAATGSTLTFNDYTTGGIVGVTTNNNADAGVVGEYQEDTEAVGVSLSTGTPANVCSISLSAGDWSINGAVQFNTLSGTTGTEQIACINTVSAALPTIGAENNYKSTFESIPTSSTSLQVGEYRLSVSGTTTIYLIARSTFSGGSGVDALGQINARRVR